MKSDEKEQPMSHATTAGFADPYGEDEQYDKSRLTTWLPEQDRMFLIGVRPLRGTVQTTINMLLKGLIDECKRRGIDSYHDVDKFEQLVVERSTLGGPIDPQRVETPKSNDGGRAEGVYQPNTAGEGQSTDVQRRSRKSRKTGVAQDEPGQGGNTGPE